MPDILTCKCPAGFGRRGFFVARQSSSDWAAYRACTARSLVTMFSSMVRSPDSNWVMARLQDDGFPVHPICLARAARDRPRCRRMNSNSYGSMAGVRSKTLSSRRTAGAIAAILRLSQNGRSGGSGNKSGNSLVAASLILLCFSGRSDEKTPLLGTILDLMGHNPFHRLEGHG